MRCAGLCPRQPITKFVPPTVAVEASNRGSRGQPRQGSVSHVEAVDRRSKRASAVHAHAQAYAMAQAKAGKQKEGMFGFMAKGWQHHTEADFQAAVELARWEDAEVEPW